mmetsp:Transcript_23745/g.35861  ORF Transcript_23745/g.35861 Transcript_23745/m.35861 type:complete len:130 (+) Transcript_23745:40-429(+)
MHGIRAIPVVGTPAVETDAPGMQIPGWMTGGKCPPKLAVYPSRAGGKKGTERGRLNQPSTHIHIRAWKESQQPWNSSDAAGDRPQKAEIKLSQAEMQVASPLSAITLAICDRSLPRSLEGGWQKSASTS